MAASGGAWKRGSFQASANATSRTAKSGADLYRSAERVAKRLNIPANPQGASSRDEIQRTAAWVNTQRGLRAEVDSEGRIKIGSRTGDQRRGTTFINAYYAVNAVLSGKAA